MGRKNIVYVGHDDGHYGQKLAIEPGAVTHCPISKEALDPSAIFEFMMPSRVAIGAIAGNAVLETDDKNVYEVTYMLGSTPVTERYTVIGDEASSLQVMDTRSKEFPVSGGLIALIYHSLYLAGLGGKEVNITTGLPYDRFYLPGGLKNDELINRKTKHILSAKVRNLNPNVELPKIVEHQVAPEGVVGHIDMLVNDQGTINHEYFDNLKLAPIGFVDIGGNTTDVVVIKQGGADMDHQRSFTITAGGLHVETDIEKDLRSQTHPDIKLDPGYILPRSTMELLARTGMIRMRGKTIDLSESLVTPAKRTQATRIMNDIRAKMKGANDLDGIWLIGGGSLLLADEIKNQMSEDTNITLVDNGEFANARGMLKKTLYLDMDQA